MIYTDAAIRYVLGFASGLEAVTVKEGESVRIECRPPEKGNILVWFRALDNSGMEFIASFSNGLLKSQGSSNPRLKIANDVLTVTSFSKNDDSGLYSCGSIKSNELKFGPVKQLVGGEFLSINLVELPLSVILIKSVLYHKVKDPVTAPAPAPKDVTTQPCPSTTTKPCRCDSSKPNKQGEN